MKSWLAAAAVAGLVSGCSSTEERSRGPVLPGDPEAVSHPPPPTPPGTSEDDAALEGWKSSVLDRADDETLNLIEKDIDARIRGLQEWDARLSYLPPGIALEERTRIARRIAFENKRLALVKERR